MTRGSILVVEDDASLRNSTRLILEHRGYEVTMACDGVEALAQARSGSYDVMLMDIRMPGMSGVEVFDAIRSNGFDAAVVFMTAYAMDDVVSHVLEAGAVEVLRKPIDMDHLLSLLEGLRLQKRERGS